MSLIPGTRLGPYEIVGPLGAGGMGEVYRATDSHLKRSVAIKVLPASMANDADRLMRFQREAEVLAALNHPNIAAIYGLEKTPDLTALVMELVEGKDLSEIIAGVSTNGAPALHLQDALPIAKQIADALEAAHEQGIVHRDLKPQNIKVRADGTVKVLDFGLAKAMDSPGAEAPELRRDSNNSPTMTSPAMTAMGMILGTAAYMSPEQAKGRAVDRRADIWAFGVVLYEMLSGRRAFEGEDVSDLLVAVLSKDVDWSALPASTPPSIVTLIRRCLQKDPKKRLRDIGEARLLLEDPASQTVMAPVTSPAPRSRLGWIVASVLALALIIALIPAVRYFRAIPPDVNEVRFQIPVHEMPNPLLTSLSPDGRWVAYVGLADDGRSSIWLHALRSLTAQALPGTDRASAPFWSPDSHSLGFVSGGKLKTMDVSGGPVNTIAEGMPGTRGTWNRDGVILVGSQSGQEGTGGIVRISARGGQPAPVTTVDKDGQETNHDFPYFLPDGKHFLYVAWSQQPQSRVLYVGTLDSEEKKRLMPAESMVVYAQGHVLFLRNRALMAQAFDVSRLELTGEPQVIAEGIPTNPGIGGAAFNASTYGALIYRTGAGVDTEGRQLLWFNRQGKNLGELGTPDDYGWVRLSNDGKRVATQLTDSSGNADVWVIDIDRGAKSRITFDAAVDNFPNWSADGRTIFFTSLRNGKYEVYQAPSTGTGGEQLVHQHPDTFTPLRDVPVDGRYLVYGTSKGGTGQRDIWLLPTFGDRKAFPFVQRPFQEYSPAMSPDSRWMAYTTNESGGPQVVVQSVPDPSRARYPVSINGGSEARWRRDGKELYFVAPDRKLMAVTIKGESELQVGTPVALFETTLPFPSNEGAQSQRNYDVTAHGQRFLINSPRANTNPSPITVILNWATGVKR